MYAHKSMDGVVPKLGVGAILLGLERSCQLALHPVP
jgi:hypothetical protein